MVKSKVLHITPHLGGGVGKALTTLVESQNNSAFEHSFLLLEPPEKSQFFNLIARQGCKLIVRPNRDEANKLMREASIVQLEWWNHPATFEFLCTSELPPMRLLVWCHVSGIQTPLIPEALIKEADIFLLTSACSYQAPAITQLDAHSKAKLAVVSSGVGLFPLPITPKKNRIGKFSVGYMGSLNFSKLHPNILDYWSAVTLSDFRVSVWGDANYAEALLSECRSKGKSKLIRYEGYTTDVEHALASLDVFAYLLNPVHYGTAENVLLEAMSLGLVPVVLANPAEQAIVKHGETGIIVDSPKAFAEAIDWLQAHPNEREMLGLNASQAIAANYTPTKLSRTMNSQYLKILDKTKHLIDFRKALGAEPIEWYGACQDKKTMFAKPSEYIYYGFLEPTKGSINHFILYFPRDSKLRELSQQLSGQL